VDKTDFGLTLFLDDGSGSYTTTASPVVMTRLPPPITTPAAGPTVTTGKFLFLFYSLKVP